MAELTKLFPMVQFKKDTWEIDEFDVASMFLLIGEEKAMLIDLGMGIGDLRGAVEMITDKPIIAVCTHPDLDHVAQGIQFDEIWMSKDAAAVYHHPGETERRRWDIEHIARRQKGCIGAPYTMFNLYPYDLYVDVHEPYPDQKIPKVNIIEDGQQFDLGGGRIVTAYHCFGHSTGSMFFLDEKTRTVIAGDCLNFNLGIGSVPVETSLKHLKRLESMKDKYDGIYNCHHDFRALGAPLDDDCLPTVISLLEDALKGNVSPCEVPSPWGQSVPLTKDRSLSMEKMPSMPGKKPMMARRRMLLRRGRCFLNINPDSLWENPDEHELKSL